MTTDQRAYTEGFMSKCAQQGIDPEWLVKRAARGDFIGKAMRELAAGPDSSQALASQLVAAFKNVGDANLGALAPAVDRLGVAGALKKHPFSKRPFSRPITEQPNGSLASKLGIRSRGGYLPVDIGARPSQFEIAKLLQRVRPSVRMDNAVRGLESAGSKARLAGNSMLKRLQ